jgi:protein-tyrosine phosphatase
MASADARVVRLAGTRNLRDLGGYATVDGRRTRWRTLFRSDCLDKLDVTGQAWLEDNGLRTVIDLRDDSEVRDYPNVFAAPVSTSITYRRLALWNDPPPPGLEPNLHEGYRREIDLVGDRMCAVVRALAEPGVVPALIHCAAGKDRTGLVVALVLGAVGVPNATIAQDYALSSACLGPEYLEEYHQWVMDRGLDWSRWSHLFETPPERMLKTLDYIDSRFGSLLAFLQCHGLDSDRVATLRELLTEPDH